MAEAKVKTRPIPCTDLNDDKFGVTEYEFKIWNGATLVDINYYYQPDGFIRKFRTLQKAIDAYNEKLPS